MTRDAEQVWHFDAFTFDPTTLDLSRDGKTIKAEPQSLRLLAYLIAHRDRVVSRADLVRDIWQDRAISDWAISAAIKALRTALGDTDRDKAIVRTVHSRGFRFVADLRPAAVQAAASAILVRMFRTATDGGPEGSSGAYLAAGLTEDLITDLSGQPELNVLSLSTSLALGQGAPGPELGVRRIVDGSLRKIGDALRITVAILDADGQRQIWAERFDLHPDALIAAQDRISAQVAGRLAPGMPPAGPRPGGTRNSAAYDAYLKGRYAYFRYEPAAFVEALAQFEAAARLDPTYADAVAQQAYCRTTLYVFGLPGADASLDPVEEVARAAVVLDPSSALAHARLGWVLGYRGDETATVAAFEAARACDPANPEVLLAYGETMNRLARPDLAAPLLDAAFAQDAFFPPSWEFARGHTALLTGDIEKAMAHFNAVLARVDRFIPARVQLVRALHETGQGDAACAQVAEIRARAPKYSRAHAGRMFPYPKADQAAALATAIEAAGLP